MLEEWAASALPKLRTQVDLLVCVEVHDQKHFSDCVCVLCVCV